MTLGARALSLLLASVIVAAALALSASAAHAQDEGELADVPTAADDAVLGASPLREEPAAPTEAAPAETAAPTEATAPTDTAAPRVELQAGVPDPRAPWPDEPIEPPVYATWWFWTAIGAVVLGITAAIVVGLTTDAPASSVRSGLALRF